MFLKDISHTPFNNQRATMGGHWNKNNKGGQQRYHKHRTDMVVPGTTGVLVSVDPASTGKAIRELKLLLESFKPDTAELDASAGHKKVENGNADEATYANAGLGSLASMLAAELDSYRRPVQPDAVVATVTSEGAAQGEGENGEKKDGPKKPKRQFRQEWFSNLETNCKGYVFMNIPKALRSQEETAAALEPEEEGENIEELPQDEVEEPATKVLRTETTEGSPSTLATSSATSVRLVTNANGYNTDPRFRVNHHVTEVVERLMTSLSANPRPVTRFSYRLVPVEASCNPTLPCILACAKELCDTLEVPEGRGLVRMGVVFNVKNNTTVQKEKNYMKAAVEASLPKSKFVVFGYWNTNWQKDQPDVAPKEKTTEDSSFETPAPTAQKFKIEVDAILHIFVAHSTCCMGLQRHVTATEGRRMYNLHDFGAGTLALGDITGTQSGRFTDE